MRWLTWLVAAAYLLAAQPGGGVGSNLIDNAGFEGTPPAFLGDNGPWQFTGGHSAIDKGLEVGGPHAGTYCALLLEGSVLQPVPGLVRGKQHLLAAWVNSAVAFGAPLTAYIPKPTGGITVLGTLTVPPGQQGWFYWEVGTFIPEFDAQNPAMVGFSSDTVNATWYIDDVVLLPLFDAKSQFRVQPPDGPAVVYDLSGIPPTLTLTTFVPEKTQRTVINRQVVERVFGYRQETQLICELTSAADEATLASVASALLADGTRVFYSPNAGSDEREVMLASSYRRQPLAGKSRAGVRVELRLAAVEVEDVAIVAGNR